MWQPRACSQFIFFVDADGAVAFVLSAVSFNHLDMTRFTQRPQIRAFARYIQLEFISFSFCFFFFFSFSIFFFRYMYLYCQHSGYKMCKAKAKGTPFTSLVFDKNEQGAQERAHTHTHTHRIQSDIFEKSFICMQAFEWRSQIKVDRTILKKG